jgi:hypothetical protein
MTPRSSSAHEIADPFYRTINRRVGVPSACAGAHGAGGYQRYGYCTDYGVARVIALAPSQDNTSTADTGRVTR